MSHSATSSDDEAPESFSFNASKKAVKGEEDAIQQFQKAEKLKRKEKNRARDQVLKERASQASKKRRGSEKVRGDDEDRGEEAASSSRPSRDDLETRMERAMREAENESVSDEDEDDDEFAGAEGHTFAEVGESGEDSAAEDEERDEEMTSEQEGDEVEPQHSKKSKDYLPDHIFASAFSKQSSEATSSKRKARSSKQQDLHETRKRKRVKKSSKDIVVGSRTIRTLPNSTLPQNSLAQTALRPPRPINKFYNRSLNLNGNAANAKSKGWERRSANLGVMKRNGPAASFVRGS